MGLTEDRQALFFIFFDPLFKSWPKTIAPCNNLFQNRRVVIFAFKKIFYYPLAFTRFAFRATVPSPAFTTCTRAELPL